MLTWNYKRMNIIRLYTNCDEKFLWRVLSNERGRRGRLVPPVRRERTCSLVVPCNTVDSWLNQNQPELWVLIVTVSLQVLSHRHGLLDQMVQVLRKCWCKAVCFQKTQDFLTCYALYLGNSVAVAEDYTNLRWKRGFFYLRDVRSVEQLV